MPEATDRWSRWFRPLGGKLLRSPSPARSSGPRARSRRLETECLEDRTLLAANLQAALGADGVLRVEGTPYADNLSVRQDAGQISVVGVAINTASGSQNEVAASSLRCIEVRGQDGDDLIRFDQGTQPITAPAYVFGELGRDTLVGGASSVVLLDSIDGTLYRYAAGSNTPRPIGSFGRSSSFQMNRAGSVVILDSVDGRLYRYHPGSNSPVTLGSFGVSSPFQIDSAGSMVILDRIDGNLYRYAPGSNSPAQIDSNVAAFAVSSVGSIVIVPMVTVADGVLRIIGSERADVIRLWQYGDSIGVSMNGRTVLGSVAASSLSQILIFGGDGDDDIRLNLGDRVSVPSVVYAGSGNDVVVGGRGTDYLYGDTGNDTLYGEAGHDVLSAGPSGADVLDPDYNLTEGNDTYLVEGPGTLTAIDEWRLVNRNGEVVRVHEHNKGEDQLFYNRGQRDGMGDDGFFDDLGNLFEDAGAAVVEVGKSLLAVTSPVLGSVVLGTAFDSYFVSGLAITAAVGASVLTGGALAPESGALIGTVLAAGAGGAAGSAASQIVTTIAGRGPFDWGQVGLGFALGAVFGGVGYVLQPSPTAPSQLLASSDPISVNDLGAYSAGSKSVEQLVTEWQSSRWQMEYLIYQQLGKTVVVPVLGPELEALRSAIWDWLLRRLPPP